MEKVRQRKKQSRASFSADNVIIVVHDVNVIMQQQLQQQSTVQGSSNSCSTMLVLALNLNAQVAPSS